MEEMELFPNKKKCKIPEKEIQISSYITEFIVRNIKKELNWNLVLFIRLLKNINLRRKLYTLYTLVYRLTQKTT